MKRLRHLIVMLMFLFCTGFWACQQENEPSPDMAQGNDLQITAGDPTGDPQGDDDDDDGEEDDDDD